MMKFLSREPGPIFVDMREKTAEIMRLVRTLQ